MKNLSFKKLTCLLLVIICAVTSISMVGFEASAVAIKPSKAVISSLKRENKNTVKLYWDPVSYAKGYQVYMRTNGGSYKKILTTTKKSLKKSGLKIGSSYYFKVRAYTKYKGKTYYGSFSNVSKIKMTSYVYLVDVMEPYDRCHYYSYKGASSLYMGGTPYYMSFTTEYSNGYATFNLKGKYSEMSFAYGGKDGDDGDITTIIYEDDEIVKTISRKKGALPKNYTLYVKDTYKLKFESECSNSNTVGFGNVKLYY